MGFSWTTFLAQIVNLFVLVWLLKRFLYQPIVDTIAKRQKYIEDKVKKAADAVKAAEERENELIKAVENWKKTKQKRSDDLFSELKKIRNEQEEIVAEDTQKARQKMQADLNRETTALSLEIRDMIAHNFLDLSRKVLADLSGLAPIEQAINLFKKKMDSLPKTEIKAIRTAVQKVGKVSLTSSEKLSPKTRQDISAYLGKTLGADKVDFVHDEQLILGIELTAGETVVEWNLKTYLDTFEGNLNTALAGLIVKE